MMQIAADTYILLFLDYDGTLTPIVKTPSGALLSKENRELLIKLSQSPNIQVSIISGRTLENIKKTVGISAIIYSGNHGLEIEGPGIKFESGLKLQDKQVIRRIAAQIRQGLRGIKGLHLEDKKLTLSLHYRRAPKKMAPAIQEKFNKITMPYLAAGKIKVNSGKKVYEIKPPIDWNKGKAVLWIMQKLSGSRLSVIGSGRKPRILPIYIGDDVTDEDAFRELKNKGITIFVGRPKDTQAQYYLKDTKEVSRFLRNDLLFDGK